MRRCRKNRFDSDCDSLHIYSFDAPMSFGHIPIDMDEDYGLDDEGEWIDTEDDYDDMIPDYDEVDPDDLDALDARDAAYADMEDDSIYDETYEDADEEFAGEKIVVITNASVLPSFVI